MAAVPPIADVAAYLEATGWHRSDESWRGASIWTRDDGEEVLLPARDGLNDAKARMWELLSVLSRLERRRAEEIRLDMLSPYTDTQHFRIFPADHPSGHVGLSDGLRAVQAVKNLFTYAARAIDEGACAVYKGGGSELVAGLVDQVSLGPSSAGSYILNLSLESTPSEPEHTPDPRTVPLERQVLSLMHDAVDAARAAAEAVQDGDDYDTFESVVSSGASSNFCKALSDLAGPDRSRPFEIGFRWAPRLGGTPDTIPFRENLGQILFEASKRLAKLSTGTRAEITGRVERVHHAPPLDRWRIRVEGELMVDGVPSDITWSHWIRLSQRDFNRAYRAQRDRALVRVRGRLQLNNGRLELVGDARSFEVLPVVDEG